MSLGSKLRKINDDADARKLAAEQHRIELQEAKERLRIRRICDTFADYKQRIISAIESGNLVYIPKMPNDWNGGTGIGYIDDSRHPDHALWVEFAEWAAAEGLKVKPVYEHDGMGMESWYVLTVKPI